MELEDCKLHSNSYGADSGCIPVPSDILLDDFMYKVSERAEHLEERKALSIGAYIVVNMFSRVMSTSGDASYT